MHILDLNDESLPWVVDVRLSEKFNKLYSEKSCEGVKDNALLFLDIKFNRLWYIHT